MNLCNPLCFFFPHSFILLASMTSCGNNFHSVIMCCVKKYFLLSAPDLAPEHFSPCSCVVKKREKEFQVRTRPLLTSSDSSVFICPKVLFFQTGVSLFF